MKKFKFALQNLLDLRIKQLEEKQIEFGKLQFVMRTLQNQLASLEEEKDWRGGERSHDNGVAETEGVCLQASACRGLWQHQKLREAQGVLSPQVSEGMWPGQHLSLGLWPSEL